MRYQSMRRTISVAFPTQMWLGGDVPGIGHALSSVYFFGWGSIPLRSDGAIGKGRFRTRRKCAIFEDVRVVGHPALLPHSYLNRRFLMKSTFVRSLRTCLMIVGVSVAAAGCMTDRNSTGDRYGTDQYRSGSNQPTPASDSESAGPIGSTLWCRQHQGDPRCATGGTNAPDSTRSR